MCTDAQAATGGCALSLTGLGTQQFSHKLAPSVPPLITTNTRGLHSRFQECKIVATVTFSEVSPMVAIAPGTKAPDFSLTTMDGSQVILQQELKANQLVVLAFFKVSCPVCQFAFPYLERLHRSYPTVPLFGISQDDADATRAFARMYGCTFPMLLDSRLDTTVAYALTNVPSVFLINQDGSIRQTIVGFVKADYNEANQAMAKARGLSLKPLFTEADEVPELRPG
jgi:peroxiredoxin